MCLICKHNALTSQIGDYRSCEYCGTRIAIFLPDNSKVQGVLEEHATSYILDNHEPADLSTFEARLALIKHYSKSAQTIIDFGCGNGNFVKFLNTKGYKVFGYDKSLQIKKYLDSQNTPHYTSTGEIPNNFFDVITCFDVIEHTTNPRFLLRTLIKKLKKNGILILSTPNSQGLSARILNERWWVFGSTAHFILFSPRSLTLLLTKSNFKLLKLTTDTLTPWFIPSEKFTNKILNKLLYLAFFPFQRVLFDNNLGDNILGIARK